MIEQLQKMKQIEMGELNEKKKKVLGWIYIENFKHTKIPKIDDPRVREHPWDEEIDERV